MRAARRLSCHPGRVGNLWPLKGDVLALRQNHRVACGAVDLEALKMEIERHDAGSVGVDVNRSIGPEDICLVEIDCVDGAVDQDAVDTLITALDMELLDIDLVATFRGRVRIDTQDHAARKERVAFEPTDSPT